MPNVTPFGYARIVATSASQRVVTTAPGTAILRGLTLCDRRTRTGHLEGPRARLRSMELLIKKVAPSQARQVSTRRSTHQRRPSDARAWPRRSARQAATLLAPGDGAPHQG